MSKRKQYQFFGTLGDIIDIIRSLPPTPSQIFLETWYEFVIEKNPFYHLHREFYHKLTKLRARFDVGQEGAYGFEGKDHWHIYNPYTKSKLDVYLDKAGRPVKDGSDESHIIPKWNGDD